MDEISGCHGNSSRYYANNASCYDDHLTPTAVALITCREIGRIAVGMSITSKWHCSFTNNLGMDIKSMT